LKIEAVLKPCGFSAQTISFELASIYILYWAHPRLRRGPGFPLQFLSPPAAGFRYFRSNPLRFAVGYIGNKTPSPAWYIPSLKRYKSCLPRGRAALHGGGRYFTKFLKNFIFPLDLTFTLTFKIKSPYRIPDEQGRPKMNTGGMNSITSDVSPKLIGFGGSLSLTRSVQKNEVQLFG
jgi:hypothetical protein